MHPDTYLNKIVLGTREGQIQLWNVATKKLIYTFQGWGSPVTCIVQSPAVDVVAIGLADGRILIHNLKYVGCRKTDLRAEKLTCPLVDSTRRCLRSNKKKERSHR